MRRAALILLGLIGIGVLGYFGNAYCDLSETPANTYFSSAQIFANTFPVKNSITDTASDSSSSPLVSDTVTPSLLQQTVAQEIVVEWIEQANDADARKRAAAIDALAVAPKAAAVPALHQVLNGGATADRQLALNSLRTLALNQGDTDGGIREVLRLVIYDGDDDSVASSAQATLEEIERGIN